MKPFAFNPITVRNQTRKPQQRGFIMIALLVIVTLMLFYVAASSRTIYQLQRELAALERIQVKRLTNSPPAMVAGSETPGDQVAAATAQATPAGTP